MPDYRELLQELSEITEFEGFVSTLIDIKESMWFYDRDLVLAGYAGTVEALAVSGVLYACLESDAAAREAFAAVREAILELPRKVLRTDSPVDVQAMAEAFVRTGGWVLVERVPVLISAFDHYLRGQYDLEASVDRLLAEAQHLLDSDGAAALERVGRVGALVLRGKQVRPRWMSIAKPRLQVWLAGLRNMVNSLSMGPASFPLDAIQQERGRRAATLHGTVVDLKAFRRLRTAGRGGWSEAELDPAEMAGAGVLTQLAAGVRGAGLHYRADPVDALLEKVFQGREQLSRSALKGFEPVAEAASPLLLALLEADHLLWGESEEDREPVAAAVRVLVHLKRHEAVPHLVRFIAEREPEEELFDEAFRGLQKLGRMAVDGVTEYLRVADDPQAEILLADLLTRLPKSEKSFNTLVELFQRVDWNDGKEVVASILANYGDRRAVHLLQKALDDPGIPGEDQRQEVKTAMARLRRRTAARRSRASQAGN